MKAKLPLYLLIVVTTLVSLIALPVLAEDEPVPMWVSRVRLAYTGRSSSGTDTVVAMVHVRDANLAAVVGAVVSATWTLPDGDTVAATATTAFQGIATFEVWDGAGTYSICVTDVTKDGWGYDPDLNIETCGALEVKWPYHPPLD